VFEQAWRHHCTQRWLEVMPHKKIEAVHRAARMNGYRSRKRWPVNERAGWSEALQRIDDLRRMPPRVGPGSGSYPGNRAECVHAPCPGATTARRLPLDDPSLGCLAGQAVRNGRTHSRSLRCSNC
jgi:hypothetical protein